LSFSSHRGDAMPEDYAVTEFRMLVRNLAQQQRDLTQQQRDLEERLTQQQRHLEERVNNLTTPVGERPGLAYDQASDWLRMVNTITWALSSIFLVGAIIAVNGASQSGVDPYWRIGAYVLVVVLCAIWWRVDFIYAQSAVQARAPPCQ
jgi:hypothetical protein